MSKIFIGEVKHKTPVFIESNLADNIEKITVLLQGENKNYLGFIVGRDKYSIGNLVICVLEGTTLKYSEATERYCKTRRGNPKTFSEVRRRNFNNLTNAVGDSIEFTSPGVLLNYYEVTSIISNRFGITKPIKQEDIRSFLTTGKINLNNYTNLNNDKNEDSTIFRFAKRIYRRITRKN